MNLLAAALVVVLIFIALAFNARTYGARVERRWPALGRIVSVEGVALHVIARGPADAPPLLFLHGATANAREFLPLAENLAAHRVLLLDRPGHGYSAPMRARGGERMKTQAKLAAGLLDAEDVREALIVCHSLGCGVGLRLAIDRPDLVRGLVLLAPASHPYPGPNAWWARLAAAALIGPLFSGTLVPFAAPSASASAIRNTFFPAQPTQGYRETAGVGLAFRARAFRESARDVVATRAEFKIQAPLYGEIAAPAVIVSSDRDRVASPRLHAQALARDLPTAELITLPGAGHMPHHTRPEAVLAAVARAEEIAAAREA